MNFITNDFKVTSAWKEFHTIYEQVVGMCLNLTYTTVACYVQSYNLFFYTYTYWNGISYTRIHTFSDVCQYTLALKYVSM